MACPRGYRGRHTGLYRDTEGKQPRARNLRTKFQAPKSAPRAATTAARPVPDQSGPPSRPTAPAASPVTMIMASAGFSRDVRPGGCFVRLWRAFRGRSHASRRPGPRPARRRQAAGAARGGRWESLQATAVKGPGTHGQ